MPRRPPIEPSEFKLVQLPDKDRPPPPKDLSEAEQRHWRVIVDASPLGFLSGAAQLILRSVVAQISFADRLAQQMRELAEAGALEAAAAVAKEHRETQKAVIAGLTSLRCTPRSSVDLDAVRTAFKRTSPGRKPWHPIDMDAGPGAGAGAGNDRDGDQP
jgi:hypothetical protein